MAIFLQKPSQKRKRDRNWNIRDWKQRSDILLDWIAKNNIPKNAKILDCGCGIGILGLILRENGYENTVGIDIDADNVKIARQNYKKVYQMDCDRISIKSKFDVAVALNLIEHLNNPKLFLENVKSILNPSGIIILSLPNEIWFRKLFNKIPQDPTHKQSWSIFSFKKFLNKNGFQVFDMKPVGRVPVLLGCQTFMILARVKQGKRQSFNFQGKLPK